jgi:cation transport regulator ChaB
MFLAQEALFIPKHICDIAQATINSAPEELLNFAAFSPFLGSITIPTNHPEMYPDMSQRYKEAQNAAFKRFSEAAERLEERMRKHIAGDAASANS